MTSEEKIAYRKAYYERNKDRIRAYQKAYSKKRYSQPEYRQACAIEQKQIRENRTPEERTRLISRMKQWKKDTNYSWRKNRYGITKDKLSEMIQSQNNKCACCGVLLSSGPHTPTSPCVHHHHRLGHIIDILCHNCNVAEGFLKTPDRAAKMAKYMARDELFYAQEGLHNRERLGGECGNAARGEFSIMHDPYGGRRLRVQ